MIRLPFQNRVDAGRQLSKALTGYAATQPLILAIPRGGVPIGRVLADELHGELDVVLVRKLGAPGNSEFAIGAVDERGMVMLNQDADRLGIDARYVHAETARQLALIRERRRRYRPERSASSISGRTVIVVDDGLATGATMAAALKAVHAQNPEKLICAIPVAARESLTALVNLADDVVCLATPIPFYSVGRFYRDFKDVDEEEVIHLLHANPNQYAATLTNSISELRIPAGTVIIEGELTLPVSAKGLVLFAHGSGSSRYSPRNRQVAVALNQFAFATLLIDLLTPVEDNDVDARFDISLLVHRLSAAVDWIARDPELHTLPLGLFGASTGAAAALRVAAAKKDVVRAVVSRGGRPDLAGAKNLARVQAPTLLIVGEKDHEVLALNRRARSQMQNFVEIEVVPHATHLFEEPGALEEVARAAGRWFGLWFSESKT